MVIGGTYKTLCAHHILPFFGKFIVGYIPERTIIGASKIPRIVEVHMRRLQSQEHLAHDVADTIQSILEPRGLAVWMGGVHMCMVMRGVEQESSFMETNVLRGNFLSDERTRQEFMSIVNSRGQEMGSMTTIDAAPGNDLRLTIDLDLQMAAEAALGERTGAVLRGASLRNAWLRGIRAVLADLSGAQLCGACADRGTFDGANLAEAIAQKEATT